MPASRPVLDLNGAWRFAYTDTPPAGELRSLADVAAAGMTAHKCRVPGNFELDLERIGAVEAPFFGMNTARLRDLEHDHLFYGQSFTCKLPRDRDAELVLEGVDCFAEVYLNGAHLGSCDNMLVEQVFDVSGRLRNGQNELFVHIRPAVDEAKKYDYPPTVVSQATGMESVYVRKAPHMYGWDIMPRIVSAGLWRPVSIRFLPKERLQTACLTTVRVAPDRGSAHLGLHVQARVAEGSRAVWEVAIHGACGKSEFGARRPLQFSAGRFDIHVGKPALWWPRGRGDAHLYDVDVSLLKDGRTVATRAFRFGIRTVELLRTSVVTPTGEGEFCLKINDERVFAKGSNWVPLDAFHSRDLARTRRALDMAADLDCNILRCWGGNVYESDLFYNLCDERGIMVWQDFAMACALYPQDAEFCRRLEAEARQVVRRLRNHACIVIWAGDNECDCGRHWWWGGGNPNDNILTRKVLPDVLRAEDPFRPYLPSSPYIDETAWKQGEKYLSENHLWGPRDYYKSDFYRNSLCCFASEIGYHGCPDPESIREFISPDKIWPCTDNAEWNLHSTCPVPGFFGNGNDNARVELMAKQIRELFGTVPDRLDDFAFASQASQAEAKKFFIEFFRSTKWRRTGIIWWNLLDGWPQFSDAIVDYYFRKKLAYRFIKASQQHLCLMLREPANWSQELVACNDRREPVEVEFALRDVDSGEVLAKGRQTAAADSVSVLACIPFSLGAKRFYLIEWRSPHGRGRNHYLAGMPPFDLKQYRGWLRQARLV